jgi:O-acetyl-ADP-ribose deacetylase (regulator of RNase III)
VNDDTSSAREANATSHDPQRRDCLFAATTGLLLRSLVLFPRAGLEMSGELSRSRPVSASSWMEDFLGRDEAALLQDRAGFLDSSSDELAFRHASTSAVWRAGRFESMSIGDLQARVEAMQGTAGTPQTRVPLKTADGIDIGKEQAALTTDDKAMVQIASNFNAIEVPSRECAPDYGQLVTNYAVDSTQGPAASFGVPAACLLRAHYPFYSAGTEPATWGQNAERQVELLEDVREWFGTCVNGKVTLQGDEAVIGDGDAVAQVADRLKVGLHTDAEVVFDRGPDRSQLSMLPPGRRPVVDQVLSASVNLLSPGHAPGLTRDGPMPEKLHKLVRACLRAAYRGAYLAAILRGRRKLLLTLIGGGVFGNPLEDILDAIAEAHAELAPRSQLEEVRVCLYQRGTAESVGAQLEERLKRLAS